MATEQPAVALSTVIEEMERGARLYKAFQNGLEAARMLAGFDQALAERKTALASLDQRVAEAQATADAQLASLNERVRVREEECRVAGLQELRAAKETAAEADANTQRVLENARARLAALKDEQADVKRQTEEAQASLAALQAELESVSSALRLAKAQTKQILEAASV